MSEEEQWKEIKILRRIASKNPRTTAVLVTAELNIHLGDPVSTKTVRRELHRSNIHGRAAIVNPLITESNVQTRKRWCRNHKTWTSDKRKRVMWSYESSFALLPTSGRVYVWRTPKEAYNPKRLVQTMTQKEGSVVV
jgi:hypothetical protein